MSWSQLFYTITLNRILADRLQRPNAPTPATRGPSLGAISLKCNPIIICILPGSVGVECVVVGMRTLRRFILLGVPRLLRGRSRALTWRTGTTRIGGLSPYLVATLNSCISNRSDFSFDIAIKYGGRATSTPVPDRLRDS